ncbi:MAG TPA: hypothetical protein VGH28_10595 [Polyangiaceae bacterium]|jgi:hypothetical protein
MKGRIAALLAVVAMLVVSLVAYVAEADPIQVWNGDLDGSTNANKIVTGVQGHPVPAPSVGALSWDGGSYYWGATGGSVVPGIAGQALFTNDAGAATVWAYPHGDVDASATEPGKLTVNAIQGLGVSTAIPSAGNALVWNGSLWKASQIFNATTLEQFGAVGDGATNDSAAMTSAISAVASGGTIQLGCGKTYLVGASSPYTVPAGVSIVGCGDGSILKTATNAAVLVAGGQGDVFRNFQILGNGTGAAQIGIGNGNLGGGGFENVRIEGCTFTDLGEAGVLVFNYALTTSQFLGTTIANDKFIGNPTYGLWIQGGYEVVTGIQVTNSVSPASSCGEGIRIGNTGNAYILSGSVTSCTTGVHLIGGGNDGHGLITLEINHNTTNLLADDTVANGEQFIGTNMYAGDITLTSATGLHFTGGQIDANNYYFDGSTGTVFNGVTFPDACCANTIHNNFNSHASTTKWLPNNTNLSGTFPSWINSGDDGTAWLQTLLGAGIQFGSQRSSGTIGTNKVGATLSLQADAAQTFLNLDGTSGHSETHLYDNGVDIGSYLQANSAGPVLDIVGPTGGQIRLSGSPNFSTYIGILSGSWIEMNTISGIIVSGASGSQEWWRTTGTASTAAITFSTNTATGTIGTNKSGATLALQTDAALSVLTATSSALNIINVPLNVPSSAQFGSLTESFGGGTGVIGIANAGTVPTSAPSGGGVVYSQGGALKWIDSSGNTFVLAP